MKSDADVTHSSQLITLLNTFYNLSIWMVRVPGREATPSSRERAVAGRPVGRMREPQFKSM